MKCQAKDYKHFEWKGGTSKSSGPTDEGIIKAEGRRRPFKKKILIFR